MINKSTMFIFLGLLIIEVVFMSGCIQETAKMTYSFKKCDFCGVVDNVIAVVTIHNPSSSIQEYDASDFVLEDKQGIIHNPTVFSDIVPSGVKLAPNGTTTINLHFNLPAGDQYKLRYKGEILTNKV